MTEGPIFETNYCATLTSDSVSTVVHSGSDIGSHCCSSVLTMTPRYTDCLVSRETRHTDRQTDMDGPVRRSLLTLERDEQLKIV
jgi:hypothetical protein